jgi:hypothetical protein
VPPPPKWVGPALAGDGDQFAAAVARRAACSWLVEWQRAEAAGQAIKLNAAGIALLGSTDWKVLKDLESSGSDLRQTIVTMADRAVKKRAGEAEIRGYLKSLC